MFSWSTIDVFWDLDQVHCDKGPCYLQPYTLSLGTLENWALGTESNLFIFLSGISKAQKLYIQENKPLFGHSPC